MLWWSPPWRWNSGLGYGWWLWMYIGSNNGYWCGTISLREWCSHPANWMLCLHPLLRFEPMYGTYLVGQCSTGISFDSKVFLSQIACCRCYWWRYGWLTMCDQPLVATTVCNPTLELWSQNRAEIKVCAWTLRGALRFPELTLVIFGWALRWSFALIPLWVFQISKVDTRSRIRCGSILLWSFKVKDH